MRGLCRGIRTCSGSDVPPSGEEWLTVAFANRGFCRYQRRESESAPTRFLRLAIVGVPDRETTRRQLSACLPCLPAICPPLVSES